MPVIPLPEGHNDTTECFKRKSKVFYSDQFLSEPSPEARLRRKYTWWLVSYLVLLFLAIVFLPTLPAEPLGKQTQVVGAPITPDEKTQLISFKACPAGLAPLWIDSTTIQCFRELPNE